MVMVMNLGQERTGMAAAKQGARPCVNVAAWAAEQVASQSCQEPVDTKGLTGRGTLLELRHHVARVDQLEREMSELSALSKTARTQVYLMVHRRAATGYVFLRWRESGAGKRHLSMKMLRKRAADWPVELRDWVEQMSGHAERLNELHLRARDALKKLRFAVATRSNHVLPRVR